MSDNIVQPRPRRVFNLTPSPNDTPESSTPAEPANPDLLTPNDAGSTTVSRTGSIMNLTSSTLYGIYSPTAFEGSRDESSPWGTEAQTPTTELPNPIRKPEGSDGVARQMTRSRLSHGLFRGVILPQTLKSALLFGFGVVYGIITIHLHENHWITPVKLENTHFYGSLEYLGLWGIAGVALGNVLPWLDTFSEDGGVDDSKASRNEEETEERTRSWVAAVRSVGAFVGVAFAMVSDQCSLYSLLRIRTKPHVTAENSVGIHHPGVSDISPDESRPLVPHRPNDHRLCHVHRRRCRWDGHSIKTMARASARVCQRHSSGTSASQRHSVGLWASHGVHAGKHRGAHVCGQCSVLRLRVFWKHRAAIGNWSSSGQRQAVKTQIPDCVGVTRALSLLLCFIFPPSRFFFFPCYFVTEKISPRQVLAIPPFIARLFSWIWNS